MKWISALAALSLSASVYASTHIEHDYSAALRGIPLNNACVTDTEVKTIKATRHCTKLVPVTRTEHSEGTITYTDWVCKSWEVSQLSYPREFTRTTCEKFVRDFEGVLTCEKTGEKADFLPKTIKIRVITNNGGEAGDNYPGVTRNFTFPDCK